MGEMFCIVLKVETGSSFFQGVGVLLTVSFQILNNKQKRQIHDVLGNGNRTQKRIVQSAGENNKGQRGTRVPDAKYVDHFLAGVNCITFQGQSAGEPFMPKPILRIAPLQ